MCDWLPPLLIIPAIALLLPVDHAPIVDRQYVIPAHGIAHLEGTAWVEDDWARIVIAGHSPGALERAHEIETGQVMIVVDWPRVEVYRVVGLWVTTVNDTAWLMPTENETLTLITCVNEQGRLIVHAERIGHGD